MVPDPNDLAIGIEGLVAEAKAFATQLLATPFHLRACKGGHGLTTVAPGAVLWFRRRVVLAMLDM